MKVTVLAARLADYTVAFLRALAQQEGFVLQLVYQPPSPSAPFAEFDLAFCQEAHVDAPPHRPVWSRRVEQFGPEVILVASWNYPQYRRLCRRARRVGCYVVAMADNPWEGRWKQWLGILVAPWWLRPAIDTFLVPGDRQAQFMTRLGFDDVVTGLYAANTDRFMTGVPGSDREAGFLYVGRLAPPKNIPLLRGAYRRYREECPTPWSLTTVGQGPQRSLMTGEPGVIAHGFVQPDRLPELYARHRCLLLLSEREPWGVVVQEAAAAGLVVICTRACGAATVYVRDAVNGWVVPPDAGRIAHLMRQVTEAAPQELDEMSRASATLGRLWTPARLARHFAREMRARRPLGPARHDDQPTASNPAGADR